MGQIASAPARSPTTSASSPPSPPRSSAAAHAGAFESFAPFPFGGFSALPAPTQVLLLRSYARIAPSSYPTKTIARDGCPSTNATGPFLCSPLTRNSCCFSRAAVFEEPLERKPMRSERLVPAPEEDPRGEVLDDWPSENDPKPSPSSEPRSPPENPESSEIPPENPSPPPPPRRLAALSVASPGRAKTTSGIRSSPLNATWARRSFVGAEAGSFVPAATRPARGRETPSRWRTCADASARIATRRAPSAAGACARARTGWGRRWAARIAPVTPSRRYARRPTETAHRARTGCHEAHTAPATSSRRTLASDGRGRCEEGRVRRGEGEAGGWGRR